MNTKPFIIDNYILLQNLWKKNPQLTLSHLMVTKTISNKGQEFRNILPEKTWIFNFYFIYNDPKQVETSLAYLDKPKYTGQQKLYFDFMKEYSSRNYHMLPDAKELHTLEQNFLPNKHIIGIYLIVDIVDTPKPNL